MHSSSWKSLLVLGLTSLATESAAAPTSCPPPNVKPGRAIYITSNQQQNSIIALPIGRNGQLSAGTLTSTGGSGSSILNQNGNVKTPATADVLSSQSAVTVADNYLFAVNAGSNTVSMFAIDPLNPTRLTMVGRPAAVPGDFPVTVGASAKNKLVCVGATGAKSGVSCASFSSKGLGKMDQLRPVGLNQTTPPVGPPNTIGQVFFSEDEETLYTTVKGNPGTNTTGTLGVFAVDQPCDGRGAVAVSQEGKLNVLDQTAVLFGAAPLPGSQILSSDAAFGAVMLSVDTETGTASVKNVIDVAGQKATCWATLSPETNTVFLGDAGFDRFVELSSTDGSIQSITNLNTGDPGINDLKAAGSFIYALSPGNATVAPAVTVFDVVSKKVAQHYHLKGSFATSKVQGLTVLA
ncbi:hypothetical protein TGAM01_v202996 [Trichoderma gamsii]|uniref:3-carboxymuconate cyclase n=1 Tax=Trichoderma gamsii TaxID=398673 RepID=A0A2K0TQC3_9HYPO|nr:hypothetical protein TGAM01_v202996 [Trichoderma gamsii]PNP47721.1 hypothetical protein TGAMA5MH_01545 [Trichoderma gamsii]PON27859.1 hypothetical protein TGAM01_v202996 [Trichoderma gamsii]